MSAVYLKGHNFYKFSGSKDIKNIHKMGISGRIEKIVNGETLKQQVITALENDGTIYYFKQKKELCCCIILEKVKHSTSEFKKNAKLSSVKCIQEKEECFIIELRHIYGVPEFDKFLPEVENDLKSDIAEYLDLNDTPAALWNNELILYSGQSSNYAVGMMLGIPVGMMFGWFIFDNIGLGICLGMAFGYLFSTGLSGLKKANQKNEKKGVK